MNYASLLYTPIPTGKGNTVYTVCARGSFIREPKVGHTLTLCGLPCDVDCHGLDLEMDMVDEDLKDKYLFVRFKQIDLAATKLTVSPEDLADQIAAYLASAGWQICNDDGEPIVPA